MPRRLTEEESGQAWAALKRRLTSFEGGPRDTPRSDGVYGSDLNAYPASFPDRLVVMSELLPGEVLVTSIRRAMGRLDDPALYFLAKEYAEGDEIKGLEWEIPLPELSCRTLMDVSPGFECYLYSSLDAWAIYFHHEGFAFCGGIREFVDVLRAECERHPLDSV